MHTQVKNGKMIALTACMVFLLFGLVGSAKSQTKAIKWDYYVFTGLNHPITIYIKGFADEVKKRTNGQLEILVRPAGELPFKSTEVVKIVSDNTVQLGQGYMGWIDGEVPLAGFPGAPFLLRNTKDVEKVWPIIKEYTEKDFARYGVTTLFYFCWPPQNLYGIGKEIRTTEDFAGRKFRTAGAHQTEMMRLLKAAPVSIDLAEVTMALQRGVMEGVCSAAFNIIGAKWADLLQWAWLPDMNPGGPDYQLVNKEALAKLPPDVRSALVQVGQEWSAKMNSEIAASEQKHREELRDKFRIKLIYPEKTETDKITKLMERYWDSWAKKHGPKAEEYVGKLRKEMGK